MLVIWWIILRGMRPVFHSGLSGDRGRGWGRGKTCFVDFADFHGINCPQLTDFKKLM